MSETGCVGKPGTFLFLVVDPIKFPSLTVCVHDGNKHETLFSSDGHVVECLCV